MPDMTQKTLQDKIKTEYTEVFLPNQLLKTQEVHTNAILILFKDHLLQKLKCHPNITWDHVTRRNLLTELIEEP